MMDNDNSLNKRPTFKRALRNISMTSIFITMMLIWLLLSVTSVLTLKQYAQKNLALTAATMTYSLEAAVVFAGNDSNLLIVFYVQIMPDDFVMQLHRF